MVTIGDAGLINKNLKKTLLFFPTIMIFELILGFSGKTIILFNLPIRYILFILSFFSLFFLLFYQLYLNNTKIISFKEFKKSYIGQFSLLDWAFVIILISSLNSALIVPLFHGGSIKMAIRDFDSILFLTLYFPLSYLIKNSLVSLDKIKKYMYFAISILSILHIIFFIGLKQDINFTYNFFNTLNKLLFNLGEVPRIILGHNDTPRVIFTTCTFLIVGIYLFLNKKEKLFFDYCILFLNVTALMTTLTKSMWYGIIIGFASLFLYLIIHFSINNNLKGIINLGFTLICVLIFCTVMNYTLFDNMVYARFASSFATSENIQNGDMLNDNGYVELDNDTAASVISNDVKIEQTKLLINKWTGSPIIGYGYGSYIKDYIRSPSSPYSYEMQAPTLLMKVGILGIALWGFLIISMMITAYKSTKQQRKDFFCWLFMLLAFGLTVQTNPMFFSFTGMSIFLFIGLSAIKFDKKTH